MPFSFFARPPDSDARRRGRGTRHRLTSAPPVPIDPPGGGGGTGLPRAMHPPPPMRGCRGVAQSQWRANVGRSGGRGERAAGGEPPGWLPSRGQRAGGVLHLSTWGPARGRLARGRTGCYKRSRPRLWQHFPWSHQATRARHSRRHLLPFPCRQRPSTATPPSLSPSPPPVDQVQVLPHPDLTRIDMALIHHSDRGHAFQKLVLLLIISLTILYVDAFPLAEPGSYHLFWSRSLSMRLVATGSDSN